MVDIYVGTALVTEGPANGANASLEIRAPAFHETPDSQSVRFVDTVNKNLPVAYTVQTEEVHKAAGFYADVYGRVRYLPAILNLGALVSGQTQELYVWNQHPTTIDLTALGLVNGDGIEVTGPTSFALAENGFQKYVITVSANGPAVVDATMVFDWAAPTEDNSVNVVGVRVVVFPFEYAKGTTETLAWHTRVLTANNGDEQRLRVRTSPRQSFFISAFVPFHLHAMAEILLYGWRDNVWGVPVFPECRTLTDATVIGEPKVVVDTANAQWVVDSIAIVYNSPTDYEIIQIVSVTATQINTVSPLTKVFSTNAIVVPVISCRMVSSPKRQTTGFGSRITVEFEAIKNSVVPSAASPVQFLGEDVFLGEQLAIENGIRDTYDSRVDTVDFASSNVELFAPWDSPKRSRVFGVQLDDQEALYNFRTWLHRRAGKLRPFWIATQEVNFTFLDTGIVNTELTARDDGQSTFGATRTHILIATITGPVLAVITAMATDGQVITMSISVDLSRDASEISHGEYLGLNRLSSDRIEFSHGSNYDSSVSVPIIEIKT